MKHFSPVKINFYKWKLIKAELTANSYPKKKQQQPGTTYVVNWIKPFVLWIVSKQRVAFPND